MSLKIENASKGFDEILPEELDFEVQKGEIVAQFGNSGHGNCLGEDGVVLENRM